MASKTHSITTLGGHELTLLPLPRRSRGKDGVAREGGIASVPTASTARPARIPVMTAAPLLVLTNLPDRESALRLARHLVEARLAACVNVLAPGQSVYRWQGAIEQAEETPLLAKTTAERYPALETAIRSFHPYELPEIVAVRIERGLPEYLSWLAMETSASDS